MAVVALVYTVPALDPVTHDLPGYPFIGPAKPGSPSKAPLVSHHHTWGHQPHTYQAQHKCDLSTHWHMASSRVKASVGTSP